MSRTAISALFVICISIYGCRPAPQNAAATAPTGATAPPATAVAPEQAPIAPTTEHDFSVRDMLAMDRLGSPTVSPDRTKVAFVVRTTDMAANRGRTDLWLAELASGATRQLTTHAEADFSPAWGPDSETLYFLSTRTDSAQVWKLALGSGQLTQVTDLPVSVGNLVVAPDGAHLAFSAEVFPDCTGNLLACTRERLDKTAASPTSGHMYERTFVRHWDTWKDGRRSFLFVQPTAGGAPVGISTTLDADVPSKPFGGAEEIAFSPDSRHIVFVARDAGGGAGEAWSTNFDLFTAPVTGGTVRKLTDNPAWDTHPVFSPDGSMVAYAAMERAGYESDRFRIVLQAWPEGEARVLTQTWDRSAREFVWSDDGKTLYATAQDVGQVSLFAIAVATGEVTRLVGDGSISAPAVTADGLLFARNDLKRPNELFLAAPDGSGVKQFTRFNDDKVKLARTGDYEQFRFDGANGDPVYGYLVKPANFDPSRKYPIAFLIHGGPQGSFGNKFHYRWNPQAYAGAGYVAIMIDFHGSTGYGQAFTDSIRGDWGGKPLIDLQKGLAYAVKNYPFLDGDRACALGASYGGFMINWIAGQWPDRFRCLVNHDGVFDQRMMYYATEELWFPEWEHGGPHFENPAGYERHNPVMHVAKWKTPMLVIHGSLDHRVPVEQGLAAFNALQRRGIKSKFLHFPDENHWVLKPANSVQWHQAVIGWLDAHLKQ